MSPRLTWLWLTIRLWARAAAHYYKTLVKHLAALLMIAGIITFSCFIFEESIQTIMFGTWAADAAKDYKLILEGAERMRRINETMDWYNSWFGWVHPPARSSYKAYHEAADFYVRSLTAKLLAVSPETLDGHEIEANFTPTSIEQELHHVIARNGRVTVILKERPAGFPIRIKGVVTVLNGQVTVDTR